jgi:hypothetical protein
MIDQISTPSNKDAISQNASIQPSRLGKAGPNN